MKLKHIIIGAAMIAGVAGCDGRENSNPWGLVYHGAIVENTAHAVNIHPTTYKLNGLDIAANIYTPADFDASKKYPAIVVAHPNGGVKEQVAGLFAQRLAEQGFVTIAADASYQGASGGMPRHTDRPANRIEDIHGMVDYISRYPGVDASRIGALGICDGGGYTLAAAQSDKRLRAVATLSMFNTGRVRRNGYQDSALDTVQECLKSASDAYDNSKFVGWSEQDETGQSYRADHAFVNYQIPVHPRDTSLIFVHEFGGDGVVWEMTPDGRDGFATLMLKKRFPTYVVDLPGRGRAGRTTATTTVTPVADEMFWFDIWRIGVWPNYNDGVQFPSDPEYLSQFFRQMTPDLSDHTLDAAATTVVANRVGPSVLVTHSAGGMPGCIAAMNSDSVRGVAAYEPGIFVFPEDDLPDRIDGLTGGRAKIS